MKTNFEKEIETIEKPKFMLDAHKRALHTQLQAKANTDSLEEKEWTRRMKRFMNPKILAPVMVVLLVTVASLYSLRLNTTAYFLTLQINPLMEIELDRDERVIEIIALNEDARILLSKLDLENKKIDEVFETIIKEANKLGYVGMGNQFEVSVRDARNHTATSNVSEITATIQSTLETTLKNEGLTNSISVVVVTKDQHATARALGISPSEYKRLIEYNVSEAAIRNVIEFASTQGLGVEFEDEFDEVIEAWVNLLKTGVSQEQALSVIRLALTSEKTLEEVEDIANVYRNFIKSGLSEVAAFTKLEGILVMDPSLDALSDYDGDEDNEDDEDSDDEDDDDSDDEDDDDRDDEDNDDEDNDDEDNDDSDDEDNDDSDDEDDDNSDDEEIEDNNDDSEDKDNN